jgi:hypothetical protein
MVREEKKQGGVCRLLPSPGRAGGDQDEGTEQIGRNPGRHIYRFKGSGRRG